MISTQKQLDNKTGGELLNAFRRFHELNAQTLVTENTEAEKRGLTNYLNKTFLEYGANLLGCWVVMQNEYQPLCDALANVLGRATRILGEREAALKAQEESAK